MDILAQVNWEQAGTVAVSVIAALGGQRGIEAIITAWRGKNASNNGNGNANSNGKGVSLEWCEFRHAELEKTQAERHKTTTSSLERIEASVAEVHRRIDAIYEGRRETPV